MKLSRKEQRKMLALVWRSAAWGPNNREVSRPEADKFTASAIQISPWCTRRQPRREMQSQSRTCSALVSVMPYAALFEIFWWKSSKPISSLRCLSWNEHKRYYGLSIYSCSLAAPWPWIGMAAYPNRRWQDEWSVNSTLQPWAGVNSTSCFSSPSAWRRHLLRKMQVAPFLAVKIFLLLSRCFRKHLEISSCKIYIRILQAENIAKFEQQWSPRRSNPRPCQVISCGHHSCDSSSLSKSNLPPPEGQCQSI